MRRVLLKCCFHLLKPKATANVSDWATIHANLPNHFPTACGELRNKRLFPNQAAFHESMVGWLLASIHDCIWSLCCLLVSFYASDVFFGEGFLRNVVICVPHSAFPDLYPSASASPSIGTCPFHPCSTRPFSIFALRAPKLLSLFGRLALAGRCSVWGSLTGWRGTAFYTIAGKLVNLKRPGIWRRFNAAVACLCSHASSLTDSQKLYQMRKCRLSVCITSAHLRGNSQEKTQKKRLESYQ